MDQTRRIRPPVWGRTARLAVAGFVVGIVGATASCEPDGPEAFNDEAADLICEIYKKCDVDLTDGPDLGLLTGPGVDKNGCFTEVWDKFDSCGSRCEFKRGHARRCLRRLESAAETCDIPALGSCRLVYEDCEPSGPSEGDSCDLWNCSVGTGSGRGAYWALGLVVLGWTRRRRARLS